MQATTDESQLDTAAANTDDGHYNTDIKVLLFNITNLEQSASCCHQLYHVLGGGVV